MKADELRANTEICMKLYGYDKYKAGALIYAEEYGIVEYHVQGNQMIYYPTYPMEHRTYKATVNLDTFKETREPLKKYYKAYQGKIGGRYCACWDY